MQSLILNNNGGTAHHSTSRGAFDVSGEKRRDGSCFAVRRETTGRRVLAPQINRREEVAFGRVNVLEQWHRHLGDNVVALAARASIWSLGEADRRDVLDLDALGFV